MTPETIKSRIPPVQLLMDGSTTAEQFAILGMGFVLELLIKRCRLEPHEKVLDLGCGLGQKARVLADYMADDARYDGIDIVPEAIEFCVATYSDKPNFGFSLADVYSSHYNPNGKYSASTYRLPYEDGLFDLIFLSSVFTHLLPEEVANYIREVRRVLRPGGRCLATCFLLNEESRVSMLRENAGVIYRFDHGTGVCRLLDADNPANGVAHDELWMRQAFSGSGLRICEMTYGTWAGCRDMLQADQDTILALAVPLN